MMNNNIFTNFIEMCSRPVVVKNVVKNWSAFQLLKDNVFLR